MRFAINIARLAFNFVKAVVVSGFDTARVIVRDPRAANSGTIRMPYGDLDAATASLLGALISLTPGTTMIAQDLENREFMRVGGSRILRVDVRLLAEGSRIGFVFVRRGIVPEGCSSWFLPRIVGMSKAAEWLLTGRVFTAEEALAGGLVSEVLPADGVLGTVSSESLLPGHRFQMPG
jgi:hypothetical protein